MRSDERPSVKTSSLAKFQHVSGKLALPSAALAVLLISPPSGEALAQGFSLSGFRAPTMSGMRAPVGRMGGTMQRPMATSMRPTTIGKVSVGKMSGGKVFGGKVGTWPGRGTGTTGKGSTADNGSYNPGKNAGRYPGDRRPGDVGHIPRLPDNPRIPNTPRRPDGPVIVAVPPPGGLGGPPPGGLGGPPPSNFSSGPPPSGPGNQSFRSGGSGAPPANERRYAPNEVLVELAGTPSNQVVDGIARRHRLVRLQSASLQLTNTTLYRWRIPDRRSVPAVIRAIEAEGGGMVVQPNYYASLNGAAAPASQSTIEQYAAEKLQLPQAHAISRGDKVLIAVIDGGVDLQHPEIAGTVVDSYDAIGSGDKVHPHGTAVVGAIVARSRLQGTAPAAQILAVRAFGVSRDSTQGTSFSITSGIDWAVTRGARIINMSFAGARDPKVLSHLAIARQRGVVLVAAAGNEGPKAAPAYPAADPMVIAVTATDENDNLFRAANRGTHIAVAAPGVDLLLPAPGNTYKMTSGTSFAAAEVSGAVALLLERRPDLNPDKVREILVSTARDLGPKGVDAQFGAGLVDAYRAVMSIEPTPVDTATTAGPSLQQQ